MGYIRTIYRMMHNFCDITPNGDAAAYQSYCQKGQSARTGNNDGISWTHQIFAKLSPAKGNIDPFDTPATSQGVHYD